MRNMLATLAFSQGVPMLSHGDEVARTQRGNNNAYAQDNETSWVDWALSDWQQDMLAFARRVVAIRHANPVLRRRSFFRGRPIGAEGAKDLTWLRPDGREMTEADWRDGSRRVLGMLISGEAADETDDRGRPVKGDTMLLWLNGGFDAVACTAPALPDAGTWVSLLDTARDDDAPRVLAGDALTVDGFSLVLLRHGAERRLALSGATTEGAAAVNALAVGGGAVLAELTAGGAT
jgi:glycogen operon protein